MQTQITQDQIDAVVSAVKANNFQVLDDHNPNGPGMQIWGVGLVTSVSKLSDNTSQHIVPLISTMYHSLSALEVNDDNIPVIREYSCCGGLVRPMDVDYDMHAAVAAFNTQNDGRIECLTMQVLAHR